MRLARISIIVAVCAIATAVTTAPRTAADESAESSTLQCTSTAPIYRVTTDGTMYYYQHTEPENGADLSFVPNPPVMGTGWNMGKPVAAPNGVIYMVWNDGALRRYRWNGTGWDTFPSGAFFEVIDPSGWDRFLTPEYRNRITVDTEGHIYTVEDDGNLHWRAYDATAGTWQHRVLAGGWNQFNLIVAAGKGVLYARTPGGVLYRYRYHAASQRWLMVGKQVGIGWTTYDRMLSAGGDVLYAVQPDGRMYWYRWDENTETWISNTSRLVGAGWNDWATTGAPDSCQRIGTTVPVRPTVPSRPNGPITMLNTSDGHIHLGYVESEGRATYGETSDLSGATPFEVSVIPGFTGVTATTTLGENQDGRVVLSANGTDAELREATRGNDDTWSPPELAGGYLVTAPTTVRLSSNVLATFALDATYGLWMRGQLAANGPFGGWLPIGGTPLAHEPLAITPTTNGVRLIGLGRNGHFQTATYENNVLGAWSSLGGGTFTGTASAVTMPDGTLQVFATDSTGTVQTQRQTSSGFPGTWTPLTGLTAAGSPSAVMSPDGTLQVVARGTDNYAYYTGQTAPGAGTYTPWHTVTTSNTTAVAPTALAVPSQQTWVVAYLTDTGEPKLLKYQPPITARTTEGTFIDIPITVSP